MKRLVASPCCTPELTLEEALPAYAELGFRKFEAFTSWAKSALNFEEQPSRYLELAARHNIAFSSFHLPPVDETEASLTRSLHAARFARALGVTHVLYKAKSRELYVRWAPSFLDGIEEIEITPVVQNHFGTPISSLEEMQEVLTKVNDPRLRALLEVGHFHSAGVPWRKAADALAGRFALVHIKDQIGKQSVPFGTGEVDLPGLFKFLEQTGYRGDYVVEMEVKDRENTFKYLREAIAYLKQHCGECIG